MIDVANLVPVDETIDLPPSLTPDFLPGEEAADEPSPAIGPKKGNNVRSIQEAKKKKKKKERDRVRARVQEKEKAKEREKAKQKESRGKGTFDVGTSRGVESMLRNSYRTQLAMIALAARKANIMISVNGFLLSLLTLGSAYVLATEPLMLVPLGLFLLTCVTAILFAVLAARPQKVDRSQTNLSDFRNGRADLLVFEHFSNLSKDDHMSVMLEMMEDKERVYRSMVAHLHFLGRSANRRFKTLQISYTSFIVGLITSFVSLLVILVLFYL